MKKICLALAACATLGTSFAAAANEHTLSLGYAQSKILDSRPKGANLKYRYEGESPVGIITSMTFMGSNDSYSAFDPKQNYRTGEEKEKFRYLSLAAGPAFRFNEFISIYGLAGVNFNKLDYNRKAYDKTGKVIRESQANYKNTSLMYGAGVQFNPTSNLTLDVGYEGSHFKASDNHKSLAINGFNAGVGYRF
ncbi:Ail/Lom family outer membrane beta-barrel protein [Sodalis sp. RH20]|uniref:Ail/Lom family outer membrane beta-barrel protein n=1 Tax=unclassified Sodalis (in: enterobacteria) TaxID=2636512 RepID=UPI0039B68697